jgi:proline iminopeptidase
MNTSGYIKTRAGEVFFQRSGDQAGIPLVCVHGGPGFTSYYLEPLCVLSAQMPVITYDQAGCGRSRREGPRKVFTIDGFVDELEDLRRELGIEKMNLLGHSFGGLIIGEYALRYPERVERLVFACVSIDIPRWVEDGRRLIGKLSLMQRMLLREGERSGATSSPEYLAALGAYYRKHIYGCEHIPEAIRRAEAEADSQTYQIVWGTNELVVNGLVKDYTLAPRLSSLHCPCLFMCGRFDEATPEAHEYFASLIHGAEAHVFEKSAHHPFATEPEESIRVVSEFLRAPVTEVIRA